MSKCLEKTIKCPACNGSGCAKCENKGKLFHCKDCLDYLPFSKFNISHATLNGVQPYCRVHHNMKCDEFNKQRSITTKEKKVKEQQLSGQLFLGFSA